ncbi:MAG: hypothetical protein A2138_26255 [Deltaproteobacteria bacterium RBG_16_71_12]|nr:MAG: hypothetical protein A2138_26255 [Deltaproteobacteria bacterium RBG_16_71_12]
MSWTALALALAALPAPDPSIDAPPPEGLWLGADVGLGIIDHDPVVSLGAGVGIEHRALALHLRVPLALRIVDLAPTEPADPPACAVIRCAEWIEGGALSAAALSRILDEARVGHTGDLVHARAGTLFSSLGAGQLVDRYTNAAEWDRRHTGLYLEVNSGVRGLGAQALVGNLLAPQELFGARVAARPLLDPAGEGPVARLLGRLQLGLELAGDAVAPSGVATDATGALLPGAATRPLLGGATQVAWPLLDDGMLQVEPWLGASMMSGLVPSAGAPAGTGAGAAAGVALTADFALLALRLEGRVIADGPGHRSSVFSTLYDLDRRRVLDLGGALDDTGVAELPAPGGYGGRFGVELRVLDVIRLASMMHVDPVVQASRLDASVDVGAGPVHVGARVIERAVTTPAAIGSFPQRSLAVLEASWVVLPPFSVHARWLHAPRLAAPTPRVDDDVVVGVAANLVLSPPG